MLAAFDQETRRKFVLFAWGHDRLPGDDEAFERSGTRLLVAALRRSRPDADEALPKAHTCFFNLGASLSFSSISSWDFLHLVKFCQERRAVNEIFPFTISAHFVFWIQLNGNKLKTELPRYSSRSVMERKFLYAISHTVTMNADEFENFSEDEMFEDEEYSEMEL